MTLVLWLAPSGVAAQPRHTFAESVRAATESLAQAAARSTPPTHRDPNRDSWWNGILVGAAIGVVGSVTTGAEAPLSGKIFAVAGFAAAGGWLDSRCERTHGLRLGLRPEPPAIALRAPWTVRF